MKARARTSHRVPAAAPPPPPARRRRGVVAVAATVALAVSGAVLAPAAQAEIRPVGQGSYTTDQVGPTPQGCAALANDPRAFLTDDAPAGAVPTNDWWSSLVFKQEMASCSTSAPLFAHPVAYRPTSDGLGLSMTTEPVLSGTSGGIGEFHMPYGEDVVVAVEGLQAPVVEVADWSDWTVTPSWSDGQQSLRATIGHGLPFSWYHVSGGAAVLRTAAVRVWHHSGGQIGFTAGGSDYAAFVPYGASWTVDGTRLRSTLGSSGFLSVAALPTGSGGSDTQRREALADFAPYAFAEVTDTRADYVYDEASGTVRTTYRLETTPVEGSNRGTVASLYPHQAAFLGDVTGDGPGDGRELTATYASPRGAMPTLLGATSFTTSTPFTGVLPEVPAVVTGAGAANERLDALLDQAAADPLGQLRADTYWTGKALGRATRIVEIADQLGRTDVRDATLAQIRSTLTDWFTADPGETEQLFAYNEGWGTLVGFPASYGSDKELNDHHFHYGYFILAAATLARFDPAWAADSAYGDVVDLLIRDANGYDRDDERFPYLRDFDIYAGHDWAAGHGAFGAGNNQESSSEGMNFASALVQWGEATGDTEVRDAGAYLYATQAAAIQQYWFDESGAIPEAFGHSTLGMVWGSGGTYSTWFSGAPEMIQGINLLPVTGGHLYLGLRPDDVRSNYAELVRAVGGPPTVWKDIHWSYLALGDGDAALAALNADPGYAVEEGESRAHTYHWVANLAALGTVAADVRADHTLAVAFDGDGGRTYVAANVTAEPLTVRFSDGTRLDVPAGKTVASGAHTWSGGSATGGPTDPDPDPDPTEDPDPDPTEDPDPDPTTDPDPDPSVFERYLTTTGTLAASPSTAPSTPVPAASGPDAQGDPSAGLVVEASGLTGDHTGGATQFTVGLDAGTSVGNGTRVRVSYDLTDDGSWDRVETYHYFATDPVVGWEQYTQGRGLLSQSGALGDLRDGRVRVEVWNVIGRGPTTVDLAGSVVRLPFD